MRRYRAPLGPSVTFFAVLSWADCITNISGFDLRQAQPIQWPKKGSDPVKFKSRGSTARRVVPVLTSYFRESRWTPNDSDRHLELLAGAEGDFFARLDLDRLAGSRIATHASGAFAHL
jgi:hypothetical protein